MAYVCPYCKSDLPDRPMICKSCGHEVRLVLAQERRIQRLNIMIKSLKQQVPKANVVTHPKRQFKISFLLVTALFYIVVTGITLWFLALFRFSGEYHVYQIAWIVLGVIYSAVVAQWSENVSVWLTVFFVLVIPMIVNNVIEIMKFTSFASGLESSFLFFNTQKTVTILLVIFSFVSVTVTLLINQRLSRDKLFSLRPFYDWMITKTNAAQAVVNFLTTLSALLAILYNLFHDEKL